MGELFNYSRNNLIKDILQEPAQAYRFIKRCWLFTIEEGRLTKLLQEQVDMFEVIGADGLIKVVDYGQHVSRIKLRRVRSQYDANAEVFEFTTQLVHQVFRLRADEKSRKRAASFHVVDFRERSVLYRVEQHHLPFAILDETEKQIELLFARRLGHEFAEEFTNDVAGILPFSITVFAVLVQQGEQGARPVNVAVGQIQEQAVIDVIARGDCLMVVRLHPLESQSRQIYQ